MPKPMSLHSTSSAVYATDLEERVLTPRTPRRHHSQYEEAYVNTSEQSVPLLSSDHAGNDQSNQSKLKSHKLRSKKAVDVPLILGALLACFLFGLIVLSYKDPEKLQEYVGIKAPIPTQADSEVVHTSSDPPPPPPQIHPLPSEYVAQCKEMNKGFMSHGDYWDPTHMSHGHLEEADQEQGISVGVEGGRTRTCSKTITYLLDGEVGLLADLALISQAAALARERNRTFFIDDTYWNRGKWSDHFESVGSLEPGPEPGCLPPLPTDLVACPRTTRHWVITAHTAKFHFGHSFLDHYEDPYSHNLNRLRPIYDAAHTSFTSTIIPNKEVSSLIHSARQELQERILTNNNNNNNPQNNQQYISVHVRRGDCKSSGLTFHSTYAPITEFTISVISTYNRLGTNKFAEESFVYFASDSPEAEDEFQKAYEGNGDGLYFSLRKSQNLGLRELASSEEYEQQKFNGFESEERYRLTRGMIVDFALLSGMWAMKDDLEPIAGVCTISSTICKMMAVGLGWEKAFGEVDSMGSIDEKHQGWVEIEQKGRVVPAWNAFTLSFKR